MSEVDLGGFRPFNDAHAIYACNLSLMFVPAVLDPATWFRIRSAAIEFGKKRDIGAPKPTYGLNLSIDTERLLIAIDRPVNATAEIVGYDLTRVSDQAEVFDRLTIATNGIFLHTLFYIRWHSLRDYWCEALNFFAEACNGAPIQSLKLEYWDIFESSDTINTDISKLLRSKSPHIIPSAYDTAMPWKSQYERSIETDFLTNRIIRVNVAVGNSALRNGFVGRAAMVNTSAQDFPRQALTMPRVLDPTWPPFDWAEAQHDVLKETLAEVISDSAIERIALRQ